MQRNRINTQKHKPLEQNSFQKVVNSSKQLQ